jgi:hypothetical protein
VRTERQAWANDVADGNGRFQSQSLSHPGKKKEEIRKWVHTDFPKLEEMTTFVQRIPLVAVTFIPRGVAEFRK